MYNKVKLVLWLSIPFLLLILPADFFDSGTSICPSQLLLGRECPGCGITRSVQHAIHFDFENSWRFNKLIVLVLPFLVYIWYKVAQNLFLEIKNNNS